jgi:ABC-type Fe3+-hydroxamate transport system substrate-binding protein
VGAPARGDSLIDSVDATLRAVASRTAALPHPRVFWMLWESPLLTIGHGSYLDTLLTIAGGQNVYADLAAPSPSVSSEDVIRRDPAVIFASPSTIASIRADARWQHTTAVRAGRILAPDTSLVGQPSVHMGQAAASLAILLHPELAGTLDPLARR